MLFINIVLLLPLVTEVFLKLLLITDHSTEIADTVLHYLGNATVAKEFQTRYVYNQYSGSIYVQGCIY